MEKTNFLSYAQAYCETRYRTGFIRYHTWKNNISRIRCFQVFLLQRHLVADLPIQDVTSGLIQEYIRYCLRQGNNPVTVNRKLQPLLLALQQAVRERLYDPVCLAEVKSVFPHINNGVGVFQYESKTMTNDESIKYLTDKELSRLVAYYNKLQAGLVKDVLDCFLFSFHACGMRVSDLITLEWRHVLWDESVLKKVSIKTRAPLVIPLSAQAMDILGRWRARALNERFVFNFIPQDIDLTKEGALEANIDNRNRSIRQQLNHVGKELGLSFPLGMHVARHTFAVKALNASRVDVHLISRLLGHSSVTVTERVYATFLLPTLCEEVRNRLSFPEYGVGMI